MTDNWEIESHTIDTRYRVPLGEFYVEPHLRCYTQAEAEFCRASLVEGQALPQCTSADIRRGDFDAMTAGVKFGQRRASGNEWSLRLEYSTQDGEVPTSQVIGCQADREQHPDLNAFIAQLS